MPILKFTLANLFLTIVWMAMTGDFSPTNFLEGFVLAYIMVAVAERSETAATYVRRGGRLLLLVLVFFRELIWASVRVVRSVFMPRAYLNPGVVAIPLDLKSDFEIMLLGHMITLTPGTLTLEVSPDKKYIYVHTMELGVSVEAFRQSIKDGFERRILEVTS